MLKLFSFLIYCFVLLILFNKEAQANDNKIVVFAAASLTNALTDIANRYEIDFGVKIQTSFASSATLAKQIARGAPADLFISADQTWTQYLVDKHRIQPQSIKHLLSNALVLISPKNRPFRVNMMPNFPFEHAFSGRLCTGEVNAVPAGIYAKQALNYLGWWSLVQSRMVGNQNVRSTLALVARGECGAGIVYKTDAAISNQVMVIGTFPQQSHAPIIYPLALVNSASMKANHFYAYLQKPVAKQIFQHYGFISMME